MVDVGVKPEGLQKLSWYHFLALVSAVVLFISLVYPIPIEPKYPILISFGFLIYSLVEWSEWGYINKPYGTSILVIPQKFPTWRTRIIKFCAILFLVILPLCELIFGFKIIPFPNK